MLNSPIMTSRQRFLAKVRKTKTCWWWTGAVGGKYGYFYLDAAHGQMSAHRASHFIFKGDPGDSFVLHTCDNGMCVRPAHLYAGTHQDNMDDAVARNRMPVGDRNGSRKHPERLARGDRHGSHTHPDAWVRGSNHPNSKLTEALVRELRIRHQAGESLRKLASEVGIARINVTNAVRGVTWSHV